MSPSEKLTNLINDGILGDEFFDRSEFFSVSLNQGVAPYLQYLTYYRTANILVPLLKPGSAFNAVAEKTCTDFSMHLHRTHFSAIDMLSKRFDGLIDEYKKQRVGFRWWLIGWVVRMGERNIEVTSLSVPSLVKKCNDIATKVDKSLNDSRNNNTPSDVPLTEWKLYAKVANF